MLGLGWAMLGLASCEPLGHEYPQGLPTNEQRTALHFRPAPHTCCAGARGRPGRAAGRQDAGGAGDIPTHTDTAKKSTKLTHPYRFLLAHVDDLGGLASKSLEELGMTTGKPPVLSVNPHVPALLAYDQMARQQVRTGWKFFDNTFGL